MAFFLLFIVALVIAIVVVIIRKVFWALGKLSESNQKPPIPNTFIEKLWDRYH